MNENTVKTYSEIYCLFKYFPEDYIKRIPKRLLELIKSVYDEKYYVLIDPDKLLEEQSISQDTKNLLVVFKYNYWSDSNEKNNIAKVLNKNEKIFQEEQRKKYDPNKVFDKKNKKTYENKEKSIIEYKESKISLIINKIKKLFKIK